MTLVHMILGIRDRTPDIDSTWLKDLLGFGIDTVEDIDVI